MSGLPLVQRVDEIPDGLHEAFEHCQSQLDVIVLPRGRLDGP